MKVKLSRFLILLSILFMISTLSWFFVLGTPSDNIPFLLGALSSSLGLLATLWFLTELRTATKEDIEIIEREK